MITYKAEDVQWFERQVAYVPTSSERLTQRLDEAINHRGCVQMAEWSDLHHQQDLAKCEAIRKPELQFQEALTPRFWKGIRNALAFLGAVALVVWMVWRVMCTN